MMGLRRSADLDHLTSAVGNRSEPSAGKEPESTNRSNFDSPVKDD
jgi:hypothetical protein